MKFVTNIIKLGAIYTVVIASAVIGYNAGETIWENGLGDKVKNGSKKLFKKEKES